MIKLRCFISVILITILFVTCLHHLFIPFAYSDTVDQHQDNHDGNNRSFNKAQVALGESFTPTITANITQFCINAYTSNGFTDGTFTVKIYATSAHLPTGSALTSGSLSSASFPSSATNVKTCISLTPFSLTADTEYAAEFTSDINDGVRYYILQATISPSPAPRANDSSLYTLDGSTWNQNTAEWFAYSESYALAPTATPTLTPQPISSPAPANNTTNVSSSFPTTSCTDSMPSGTPDLFQINVTATQATLYFSPIFSSVTNYAIVYGYSPGDRRFTALTNLGRSSGVLSYTINNLDPSTKYAFIIRAENGCTPGNWGNTMEVVTTNTKSTTGTIYYKNLLTKIFSIFPRQVTVLGLEKQNISNQSSCSYTVQPGDSLWSIAEERLGSGNKYQQIIDSNKITYSSLSTSFMIQSGWKLKVGC